MDDIVAGADARQSIEVERLPSSHAPPSIKRSEADVPATSPLLGETLGTPFDTDCSSSSSGEALPLCVRPSRNRPDNGPTTTPHVAVNSGTDNDAMRTLQVAHQLALTRVVELEVQLRERSQQLAEQQEKVEGSRSKIAGLSSAVQMLKKKVEQSARRDNMLRVRAGPSSCTATQTEDDWEQAWHDAYAAQQAMYNARDAEADRWRRVAERLEVENAALQAQLAGANHRVVNLTQARTQLSDWAHGLVDACLVASASSSAACTGIAVTNAAQQRLQHWNSLTLDEADRYLGGDGDAAAAILQTVAAVVGGGVGLGGTMRSVQDTLCAPCESRGSCSTSRADEGDAPSPPCRRDAQLPTRSPQDAAPTGVEGRSLLEELARASSAAQVHGTLVRAADAPGLKAVSSAVDPRQHHNGSDTSVELRAIELRIEGLRNALLQGTAMPPALRKGIEVELQSMQDQLAVMADEKAHAMRLAMHRRDAMDGGVWQHASSSPQRTSTVVPRWQRGEMPPRSPQGNVSPLVAVPGQGGGARAVSMSPIPAARVGGGLASSVVQSGDFVMRSPSEEALHPTVVD